ncbi:hypothetical protein V6N12_010118 [Hibiscus sabdariffa]|uniref:Uncharacterized protein n=1 Tax=Hibiscus sabdariffa TaxID=183260 RepID=A0ABR2ECT0_9ROSI
MHRSSFNARLLVRERMYFVGAIIVLDYMSQRRLITSLRNKETTMKEALSYGRLLLEWMCCQRSESLDGARI